MGGSGNHERAPRGVVRGWSIAAARRQKQWAYTVQAEALGEFGYAVTLTVTDTPATAEDFHRARRAYLKRLERLGLTAYHWVIEWQARGTPHLHMALYFDHELELAEGRWKQKQTTDLLVGWLEVSAEFGSGVQGQVWDRIVGSMGWLKYLAKHATRGVNHYQRQGAPEGWESTGRLWGVGGDWPVVEPVLFENLSLNEFYRIRRIIRGWSEADARKAGDTRRLSYLKKARRMPGKDRSRYFGSSEWLGFADTLPLIDFLRRENVGRS